MYVLYLLYIYIMLCLFLHIIYYMCIYIYIYIFCEFKHVHTSRLGVHEAVAFISGTFALKLKARRGLVVPKTTRDHPGKRFALGRRHLG